MMFFFIMILNYPNAMFSSTKYLFEQHKNLSTYYLKKQIPYIQHSTYTLIYSTFWRWYKLRDACLIFIWIHVMSFKMKNYFKSANTSCCTIKILSLTTTIYRLTPFFWRCVNSDFFFNNISLSGRHISACHHLCTLGILEFWTTFLLYAGWIIVSKTGCIWIV